MSAQELGFKAEVQQLLDLMIHSVYSDRDVFLRELISNAADALDKARFLALTRDDLVPTGSPDPGIRVTADPTTRMLIIEDDGIGMTHQEVIDNLGTIARSGSKEFVAKLKEAGGAEAPRLIGQFGVGFYSSFMAADEVEVITRSALPDSPAVRWHSKGAGTFTVEEADKATRGTKITLFLREDAEEYCEKEKINEVIKKHSNYLPWPILVDGEKANTAKALWAENPSKVTDDEANAFYRNIAGDWKDAAFRIHVSVDSPIQYHAMLFIPEERPYDLFNPRTERGPRLYARRVLITEHAQDLLPEWLRFVRGVVDSEDIQLNVSREMVQKTPIVRKIRENLVRRLLKDLAKYADENGKDDKTNKWPAIWKEFGILLKEGYYAAPEHRDLVLPLLRFNAVSHDDASGTISLAEYEAKMPEGQDTIWYIAAENRAAGLASPHLEAFKKRGWDVLLFTDPVDEWLGTVLEKYEEIPLKSVTRGDLALDDADTGEKADITGLAPWLEGLFTGSVSKVRASSRLTDSAVVLVDDDAGITSNMERILRQAQQFAPAARRILEVNPRHPLIVSLAELQRRGNTDEAEPIARLLLDDALLLEGNVKEPAAMAKRLQDLLARVASRAVDAG